MCQLHKLSTKIEYYSQGRYACVNKPPSAPFSWEFLEKN